MIEAGIPATQRSRPLVGWRVLVVEDDFFLADDLAVALRVLGANVIGPVATFADGLMMIVTGGRIDFALLDLNLRGEMAYALAEILLDRGVDVVLATGYEQAAVPWRFSHLMRFEKPFDAGMVARALPDLKRRDSGDEMLAS